MLSQQVVDDLTKAFESFYETTKDIQDHAKKMGDVFARELTLALANRFFFYVEKYSNASILTRWCWRKKINKMCNYTLPYLYHFINEIKL